MNATTTYLRAKPKSEWVILRNLGKKEEYWSEVDRRVSFQLVLYKNEEKKEYMLALHDDDDYIVKFSIFGEVFDPEKYTALYDAEFVQDLLDNKITRAGYAQDDYDRWLENQIHDLIGILPMYQNYYHFHKLGSEDIVAMAKTLFLELVGNYATAQTKEQKIEKIKNYSCGLIFSKTCEFDETEIAEIYDFLEPYWLEQQKEGNYKSWW